MAGTRPDTQGGGHRGGPRRWTGNGPRPARHIPWPELFKHHQSVLTGHLKMMDMVRKHCAEGSGNQKEAQACVDRTHEMIRSFKKIVNSFVPPRDNIDRVPLGASSASMYPGYSPADHIYGEAAAEYGMRMAEAKRKGLEVKTDSEGLEYIVGQSSSSAREQIEAIRKEREEEKAGGSSTPAKSNKEATENQENPMEEAEQIGDVEALFTIDSNPTPIDQLQGTAAAIRSKNKANDKAKRRISTQEEAQSSTTSPETHKKKKVKISKDTQEPANYTAPEAKDEFEEAVIARHREKEEKCAKKKNKEGRKRKRESDTSAVQVEQMVSVQAPASGEAASSEKPKKKKKKVTDEAKVATAEPSTMEFEAQPGRPKKKKKRPSVDEGDAAVDGDPSRKKKHKKEASA